MLSRRTRKDHTGSERTARAARAAAGALVESLEGRQLFAATLFTLDPAQSVIVLSGSAVGFDLKRQDDASLRAKYDGFIVADVTADTIQFPGGSEVAAEMRGSFDPGDAPANYAAAVDGPFNTTLGEAALRNLVLDLTSAALPLAGGTSFASSGEKVIPTSGTFVYDVDGAGRGDFDLAGEDASNTTALPSTVITAADGSRTLTIPVDVKLEYGSPSAELTLKGKIVATSPAGGGAGDAPRVDANGGQLGSTYRTIYTIGGTGVRAVDDAATVRDFNSATLTGATAAFVARPDGTNETLEVDTAGTPIDAAFDAATGVLTLSGEATPAQYQQVLRTLTYDDTLENPTPGERTIRISASDATGVGAVAESVVSVEEPFNPGVTKIGVGANKAVTFADADGTLARVTLVGGGTATVRFAGAANQTATNGVINIVGNGVQLTSITATGTTALSKLNVVAAGGSDGTIDLGSITSDGPLNTVGGRGVNLTGALTVPGRISKATFSNLNGAEVTAGSILKMTLAGEMRSTTLTVTDPFAPLLPTLGVLTAKGQIVDSSINVTGNVASIKAAGLVRSGVYVGAGTGEPFPAATAGAFANEGGLLKLALKAPAGASAFDGSVVLANNLGKLNLGATNTANGGAPFGIVADTIAALTATDATGQKLKLTRLDDPAALATLLASNPFAFGDFQIRLV